MRCCLIYRCVINLVAHLLVLFQMVGYLGFFQLRFFSPPLGCYHDGHWHMLYFIQQKTVDFCVKINKCYQIHECVLLWTSYTSAAGVGAMSCFEIWLMTNIYLGRRGIGWEHPLVGSSPPSHSGWIIRLLSLWWLHCFRNKSQGEKWGLNLWLYLIGRAATELRVYCQCGHMLVMYSPVISYRYS